MAQLIIERGIPHAALVEHLQSDAKLAVLVDFFKDESIDGDTIIDAIEVYFCANAPVAALGRLAREAFLFLQNEAAAAKKRKKD